MFPPKETQTGMESLWKGTQGSLMGCTFSDRITPLLPSHCCCSANTGSASAFQPEVLQVNTPQKPLGGLGQQRLLGPPIEFLTQGLRGGAQEFAFFTVPSGAAGKVLILNSTGLTPSLLSYWTSLCPRWLIYKLGISTFTSQGSCED